MIVFWRVSVEHFMPRFDVAVIEILHGTEKLARVPSVIFGIFPQARIGNKLLVHITAWHFWNEALHQVFQRDLIWSTHALAVLAPNFVNTSASGLRCQVWKVRV